MTEPDNDVKYFTGIFKNRRGQRLYYRRYSPLENKPKAALIFHHGYPGHLGIFDCEYCHLFTYLQDRGIAVFAYDAHGFGRSEPQDPRDRLFILSIQYMVDDFLAFREGVVGSYADSFKVPVFAAGISMGGLVSTLAVMESPKSWQGLVALAPAYGTARLSLAARLLVQWRSTLLLICPRWAIIPGNPVQLSSPDPAVQEFFFT
eukprot:jgi/Botrbrau1/20216/Bobra.31_1s0013.1